MMSCTEKEIAKEDERHENRIAAAKAMQITSYAKITKTHDTTKLKM